MYLFSSVTQKANHARDYLLGEGLEKIDGYENVYSTNLNSRNNTSLNYNVSFGNSQIELMST